MLEWFSALPLLEQVFFYIALPSTIILLVQMIMLFIGGFGMSGGDLDLDSDTSGIDADVNAMDGTGGAIHGGYDIPDAHGIHDASHIHDTDGTFDTYGLRFMTMRGIITFLTVTGWTGVCFVEFGLPTPLCIIFAVLLGTVALVAIAFLVRSLLRLSESGNIDYRTALGQIGSVYIPIPANRGGLGKITLNLSDRYSELDAVSNSSSVLKTGEVVRVVDIIKGSVMVVEPEDM